MFTPLARRAFLPVAILAAIASRLCAQVTEIPQTVAPGKILVRMDGLSLGFDHSPVPGTNFTALGLGSTVLSAGLTDSVDLQVGATLFLRQTYDFGGRTDSRSGLGDLRFRVKWTCWRDAALGTALALMPYVKVPSNTGGVGNKKIEGGLIVPWAMTIPGGVTAGAMFQWAAVRNDSDRGYDAQWKITGAVQRRLTSAISLYGEGIVTALSTGISNWTGTIGGGALLRVTKSIELDYELQSGVNRRATDWTHVFRVNWEW